MRAVWKQHCSAAQAVSASAVVLPALSPKVMNDALFNFVARLSTDEYMKLQEKELKKGRNVRDISWRSPVQMDELENSDI